MKEYRLSERAARDLDEIVTYRNSVGAAYQSTLAAIDARCRGLALMPESGKSRDDLAVGLRYAIVGRFLIFYVLVGDDIEIARIIHGHRDLGRIFGGPS